MTWRFFKQKDFNFVFDFEILAKNNFKSDGKQKFSDNKNIICLNKEFEEFEITIRKFLCQKKFFWSFRVEENIGCVLIFGKLKNWSGNPPYTLHAKNSKE